MPRQPLALSALDLVPLVEGGSSVTALQGAAELARTLDGLGYTRLWYAEHHNMRGIATANPALLVAHVGARTTRIRLGSGGVMLPNHSPLSVAENYKLLEAMYPGRIDLGIGRAPGTDGLTALALRRTREALGADDFPEQMAELMAWGKGEFPDHHAFRAICAIPDDSPLPPIYMLGSSDFGARMAAQLGVSFAFAGHFSMDPPELPLLDYRARFKPRGTLTHPHAILALPVYCADTEAAARRMASSMLLSFARLRTGRPGRMPSPDEAEAHVYTREEQAIVAAYGNLQIVGTPAQVHERICAAAERSRADEIMLVTHAFDPSARMRSYQLVAQAFGLSPGVGDVQSSS